MAEAQGVLPGYFETLGSKLIAGRLFDDHDNLPGHKAIIVDDFFAARVFPNRSAVGQRIDLWEPGFEIVGVVAHQRQDSLTDATSEQIYLPDGPGGLGASRQWAIRTTGDPMRLAPALREALKEVDPLLLPREIQPMSALVDRAQSGTRFALLLISLFAGVAAMLAAIGLYGVLATVVRQRTAEIGIRMALGAEPRSIFSGVVGEGLKLSAAGIAVGIVAALAVTRLMTSLLVGVKPNRPVWTFAAVAAIFLVIAALAMLLSCQARCVGGPRWSRCEKIELTWRKGQLAGARVRAILLPTENIGIIGSGNVRRNSRRTVGEARP